MKSSRAALVALFGTLFLCILLGLAVWNDFRREAAQHLELDHVRHLTAYRSVIGSYREFAEIAVSWLLADRETRVLIERLDEGDNQARGALYRRLAPLYEALRQRFIKVVQFTGSDGRVLLRMHAPDVADDNAGSRAMIQAVLNDGQARSGFEYSPRISGYRFVHPVGEGNVHSGVLELGMSFTAVRRLMRDQAERDTTVRFLLRRERLEKALGSYGEDTARALSQTLYRSSPVSAAFFTQNFEHPLFEEAPETLPDFAERVEALIGRDDAAANTLALGNGGSLRINDGWRTSYLVHFLPVLDAQGGTTAYILVYAPDPQYAAARTNALAVWLGGSLLIAALALFGLKTLRARGRLLAVGDHVGQGIFVQDSEGVITYVNPRACEILGYSQGELLGQCAHPLFHQRSCGHEVDIAHCDILRTCRDGHSFHGSEEVFRARDGREIPVEVTANPVFELGNVTEVVTVFNDIGERLATQARLRQSDAALNHATEGIFVADPSFRIGFVNQAFTAITGFSLDDVAGKPLASLMHNDMSAALASLLENGEWHGEMAEFRKDGSDLPVWLSLAAIPGAEGEVSGYVGIFSDISEIKNKDALLIQQSRLAAMGEMVHNIAHQWRQPLNALGLLMQNLTFDFKDGELSMEDMERAANKAMNLIQGMSRTIDDFRYFFRPDHLPEDFDLIAPIEEALEITESSLRHHSIRLDKTLEKGLIVHGHANQFAQAVLNLVSNAKDALLAAERHDPQVTLTLFRLGKDACLTVEDNAGGIPEEMMARIFEPYFTTKEQGSGIGLYMTRTIVERNLKGSLSAINGAQGARFTICVPLGEKAAQ